MTLYIGMSRNDGQAIADTDHLRQSVRDILLTPQGSRLARREYGSLLSALIDQPQNPALRLQIMSAVYVALNRWEPALRWTPSPSTAILTALWWLSLPDKAITARQFPFPYQQEQTMPVIDLSRLPPPQIVDVPDFEALLAERKAAFVALHPADEQEAVMRTLAQSVITITRKAGDGHRFTLADRGAYTGVIASWLHTREPRKKETTSVKRRRKKTTTPKEPEAKQGDYLVGTDENVLVLNRTYANRSNAERAAKMQWERLQRGVASFSLQLAEGRADLYTEMPVKVTGFKQPIDDAEWTITTLTHSVSPDNGFTTSMELEVKIDEFAME